MIQMVKAVLGAAVFWAAFLAVDLGLLALMGA
jgi:hypothetical protein